MEIYSEESYFIVGRNDKVYGGFLVIYVFSNVCYKWVYVLAWKRGSDKWIKKYNFSKRYGLGEKIKVK